MILKKKVFFSKKKVRGNVKVEMQVGKRKKMWKFHKAEYKLIARLTLELSEVSESNWRTGKSA